MDSPVSFRRNAVGHLFKTASLSLISALCLGTALLGAASVASAAGPSVSGQSASVTASGPRVINMAQVPQQSASSVGASSPMPLLTGHSSAEWANIKAAAATSSAAPVNNSSLSAPSAGSVSTTGPNTPGATVRFAGLADSAGTCPYFGGCAPPDQALAASPNWVLQAVNTSVAVYNTAGTMQAGFPKSAQAFFGIPNEPNNCDPNHGNQPFLSDPRAFFDQNTGRFWVAMLQVENAFGIAASCPFQTTYWVAVSQTNNPAGAWFVYAFNMAFGSDSTGAADYTQFGFDGQAIYFSGNIFNNAGSAYEYAEFLSAKKSAMQAGAGVSAFGFFNLSASSTRSVLVDTVQPVMAENYPQGPRAGFLINSFNINGDPFGHDCFSSACNGLVMWAVGNPGTSSITLSGWIINTANYIAPPGADEPGCAKCIETLDTRISGTPVYHTGLITFGLDTGVNNGTQVVPGIFWGQVYPTIDDTFHMNSLALIQQGYFNYSGDGAASFPALMPDDEGNLTMVFEFMNSSTNPESAYVSRRATLLRGRFHDGGIVLFGGAAATFDQRWGDYEACSYDGRGGNHVWCAGENAAASGDWATGIGRVGFTALSQP